MIFDPSKFEKDVLIQDDFFKFLEQIKDAKIELPRHPDESKGEFQIEPYSPETKISIVENDSHSKKYQLNANNGYLITKKENTLISAYDESIVSYSTLEGKTVYVSHSLIFVYGDKYYPINKLTLLFITGSQKYLDLIPGAIKKNERWGIDTTANVEIAKQKKEFLKNHCYDNSILLIDGPLIAGDGMATFIGIIQETFLDRNIVPVFIVKNSSSNLVIDNIAEYKGLYNSDLHLFNELLKPGEVSAFYRYSDLYSSDNTKVFCYMKYLDKCSPIRIEFPTSVYEKNLETICSIMDLIYYLILVQGDFNNPQARPIAIAEKYARETLHLIDFGNFMKSSRQTATFNVKRGMDF